MQQRTQLGVVVSGSFIEGLAVRVGRQQSIEDLRVGRFVVIDGEKNQFFAMVTDVQLEATSRQIAADPPPDEPFFRDVLSGASTYGLVTIMPQLMLPRDVNEGFQPVRTVPRHFAPVFDAGEQDFSRVFGSEDATSFAIGTPLDMDVPVHIDLKKLVQRSNGVFGKSGTGKSFLTRLLLCGTIKAGVAANLIFDMHSEYGWSGTSESGAQAKGLRQLFGEKVLIYTVDPKTSQRRGVSFDQEVILGYDQIEVEDILLLREELNLTPTAAETSYLLAAQFGKQWFSKLLSMPPDELKEFAEQVGGNYAALSALKRRLEQIPHRLDFVKDEARIKSVDSLINALQSGMHVVLEFGRFDSNLAYMLVANVLTRRIYERWREMTENFLGSKNAADKPTPLVITIEEAHKFLNPGVASQTIFGTIAREMRKYAVTLLVVDQRPSSIDSEVLSQLGTRITAKLNDSRDIDAVFTGVGGGSQLKGVLSTLDEKQQSLILGYAVPMPVAVRTRAYDEAFYRAMFDGKEPRETGTLRAFQQRQEEVDELFP